MKISYLKNIFLNIAEIYIASILKIIDYYFYLEEIKRIITNFKTIDQFKAINKQQLKKKGKDFRPFIIVTIYLRELATIVRVNIDRNTIIVLI